VDSTDWLPDRDRFSVVMAVILLAYAVARFVQAPGGVLGLEIAGIYLPLQIGIGTMVAVLVAGLTASGTDWLLRDNPRLIERNRYSHLLLPAMTAWILSLPLANLPVSPAWWEAFGISAFLIFAIIVAEFNSISLENRFYSLAVLSLTALSYALFLILAISIRGLGLRLYLALPAIGIGAFLTSARIHFLRSSLPWRPLQSLVVAFVIAEIASALHYLRVSALGYGLALLGLIYAISQYLASLNLGMESRAAAREPLFILSGFIVLAIVISVVSP
jgi:hypothetical protein